MRRRQLHVWTALLAAAAVLPPAQAENARYELSSTDGTLWLARIQAAETQVLMRRLAGGFQAQPRLAAPVARLVASSTTALVVLPDGAFYIDPQDNWKRLRDLPGRIQPIDIAPSDAGWLVLAPSPTPGELTRIDLATSTTQPFDPGNAELTLVIWTRGEWRVLAAAPLEVHKHASQRLRPRLAVFAGTIGLYWCAPDQRRLRWAVLDLASGSWSPPLSTSELPELLGFWVLDAAGIPAIAAVHAGVAGGEEVLTLRQFGDVQTGSWQPSAVQWSELPESVEDARYYEFVGFNQQLVGLVTDARQQAYLRFGRVGDAPTEPTLQLEREFAPARTLLPLVALVQAVMLVLLLGTLMVLFILRRDSLMSDPQLPAGVETALLLQRLLGAAFDFIPLAIAAAIVLRVSPLLALQELLRWATGFNGAAGLLPSTGALSWWALAGCAYVVYTLLAELAVRRTLGKKLLGLVIVDEEGRPAGRGRLVVRNLCRIIELLPPLWVLNFVMVFSRRRVTKTLRRPIRSGRRHTSREH